MSARLWLRIRIRTALAMLAGLIAFVAAMADMAHGPADRPQLRIIGGAP